MAPTLPAVNKASLSSAARVAKWALPLLLTAGRWLQEHPEALEQVREQIKKLLTHNTATPEGMLETIEALRDSVAFLAASADDEAETQRAEAWAKQLDAYEQAAKLLAAPGSSGKEKKQLKKKLEALRSEILEASITEHREDADAAEGSTSS